MSKIGNIFKVTELRNKILFTLAMLLIYRLGVSLRAPGVDAHGSDPERVGLLDAVDGVLDILFPLLLFREDETLVGGESHEVEA